MQLPLFVVDAFAEAPFSGNPATVVLLDQPRGDHWMQSVAAEMNLSETAFVEGGRSGGGAPRSLRWFTPAAEVDLCGHATLAAAHVLGGTCRFITRSGELTCIATDDGWVEMDFPADDPTVVAVPDDNLSIGLPGITFKAVARGVSDVLVEAGSADEVQGLVPDTIALARVPARGIIVTAPSTTGRIDFVSRCFYPAVGVPEDPVTGSAHCTLAVWWMRRLGRSELTGSQISRRGGTVRMVVRGDRVALAGKAVTVLRGQLLV